MKRFAALLAMMTIAVGAVAPGLAEADVNDFTVTDFSADYYLTRDDPQGQLRVVEKIAVNFTDNNHGILRAIPESYKGHSVRLHINKVGSDSGAPVQYTTYGDSGNEVLKIGDPSRTVTGNQEYTIDYTLQNVITFYPDHDELYWDVNGDQWQQPFDAVSVTLHLPADTHLWSQTPVCYTGSFGSTAQDCAVSAVGNTVRAITTRPLNGSETLTLVAGFDKGFFQPMTWRDYVQDYWIDAAGLLGPIVLLGGAGFLWWLKRGRDAKGTGVIIPQYDAPDGMKAIEVGALADFRVESRDLTATLIDLAVRKFIKITEVDSAKLLTKRKGYTLTLLNKDWAGLNDWERSILAAVFSGGDAGTVAKLDDLKAKLYTTARSVKRSVDQSLTDRGYFVANPTKFLAVPVVGVIIVAIIIVQVHLPILLAAGIIAGAAIFAVFYHFMPARTAKGVAAKEHILGLKMYLEVAEKDRIAMLQSPDAPYAPKSTAPERTVELFEKLLPYAIVLRVEKQWAAKFADIYKQQPDWYGGNPTLFSAGYMVGALSDNFSSAVNASFASPSSSGGSGFGGGAGGGGGGGGGGGW